MISLPHPVSNSDSKRVPAKLVTFCISVVEGSEELCNTGYIIQEV